MMNIISNVVTAFNDGFQLDPTSYGWSLSISKKDHGFMSDIKYKKYDSITFN